ncbi:MAG: sulfotransferase family 2 domain-containing protein [Deltaproteobacteria bacterium]|nr:sulfotransferase family 2 domain-containing protein [Deltaproteobacteria bacterium]MBN2672840.1 sulfotransferase family 2 domain-containing protein [Deltaproteobacteria bacterium]
MIRTEPYNVRQRADTALKLFGRKKIWRLKNLTLIFPDHQVNLFLNPKVGTSTIKNICLANLNPALYEDMSTLNLHEDVRRLTNHGLNYSTHRFFRYLNNKKSRNFLFVRNPYARLLSAYLDKIVDPKRGSGIYTANKALIHQFATDNHLPLLNEKGELPFDTFVRWVVRTKNPRLNIHWAVQSELAWVHNIRYSNTYKLEENFNQGLYDLIEALHFDPAIYEQKLSRKVNAGGAESQQQYYTAPLAELVYKKYQTDFVVFGYQRDSWGSPDTSVDRP